MTQHTTRSDKTLTDTDTNEIAAEFEQREFTNDEISTIKKTRRRSPRIGDSNAEVVTFRAPPKYKLRIVERAHAKHRVASRPDPRPQERPTLGEADHRNRAHNVPNTEENSGQQARRSAPNTPPTNHQLTTR